MRVLPVTASMWGCPWAWCSTLAYKHQKSSNPAFAHEWGEEHAEMSWGKHWFSERSLLKRGVQHWAAAGCAAMPRVLQLIWKAISNSPTLAEWIKLVQSSCFLPNQLLVKLPHILTSWSRILLGRLWKHQNPQRTGEKLLRWGTEKEKRFFSSGSANGNWTRHLRSFEPLHGCPTRGHMVMSQPWVTERPEKR